MYRVTIKVSTFKKTFDRHFLRIVICEIFSWAHNWDMPPFSGLPFFKSNNKDTKRNGQRSSNCDAKVKETQTFGRKIVAGDMLNS